MRLRRDLVELQDYVLVCQSSWDLLSKTYGGGPALRLTGPAMLHPLTLNVRTSKEISQKICICKTVSIVPTCSARAHLSKFNTLTDWG